MGFGAQKHGSSKHGSKGGVTPPPAPFPIIEQGLTGEGDVLLCQTENDGEIYYVGGLITMHGGLRTSSYLSLFGGNEKDDGSPDNEFTWWGNIGENDPATKYISITQNLLRSIPATTNNLKRVKTAVEQDLQWMLDTGLATDIDVSVSIPGFNKIKISGTITTDLDKFEFKFIENWENF